MRVFEVSRPTVLRDYLKVLNVLVDEVNLEFSPEGLSVVTMDPSHVAMIDFHLPYLFFDRWDVEESFKVCMNLEDLNNILKKLNKRDTSLTFEYDYEVKIIESVEDQDGNTAQLSDEKINEKVTLTLRSDIKRKKVIDCLQVIDIEVPKPKIYFKSETRLLTSVLKRILDDFKGNSEHVTIKTNFEGIEFSSISDIAKETTPIDKDNDNILEHRVQEDTRAVYTFDYFHKFIGPVTKISEVATLQFSEDMPFALDVELPQGRMIYYLAPCIGV